MNRWQWTFSVGFLTILPATAAVAIDDAQLRVVHASPDAPAVDVLVDDVVTFADVAYTEVTGYLTFEPGEYNIQLVPAGESEPVIFQIDVELEEDMDYTAVAVDVLDEIDLLLLTDSNIIVPVAARVRFVHVSPDAPAVDLAIADGGPVLFSDIEFREASEYLVLPSGPFDLELRLAGTDEVVLSVPDVVFQARTVYTIFAMGLAEGPPDLEAVISEDATSCEGDIFPDGDVNVYDLLILLALWGDCPPICVADLNGDAAVDVFDLLILLGAWGPCP